MRPRMLLLFVALMLLARAAEAQTVPETVAKVNAAIARSDRSKFVVTAALLRHWRGATGTPVALSASAFAQQQSVLATLSSKHRAAIIAAAIVSVRDGDLAPGTPVVLSTTSTARGSGDLYYALGDFTLSSQVQVSVTQLSARQYRLTFNSWQSSLTDRFAFAAGQHYVFPAAALSGNALLAVEAAGLAAPFDVTSATANITASTVLRSVVITP